MKKTMALILSLVLIISMTGCGKNAAKTTSNMSGADVDATTKTGTKSDGVRPEDLTTGIIYDRSDVSASYWDETDVVGSTNQHYVDSRFENTMNRPFISDEKLQIAPKYSFYLQAGDMFHMTVNKENLFYPVKNIVLTKDHAIDLAFLATDCFYNTISLEMVEYDKDEGWNGSYDDQTAQYDRDNAKYETKELNGWRVILRENEFSLRSGGTAPGFYFDFFYELTGGYFLTAKSGLICDRAGADLFIDKFANDFSMEKVSDSEGVAGVEIENFKKIKLNENITLNLENGTNFGVMRPDNLAANMVNFVPDKLTFDGTDVSFVKILEIDKSDSDTVYGDTDYEYKDFTYKGIKTTLRFYTSDIDILGAISGDDVKTEKETRLEYIYFETDNYIYGIYAMVGTKVVTTDQDYEAFVTLLLDRMLEVT